MLYSKIMVPYDGSEHAKHALEYAKGLVAISDAKIAIVHVVLRASWASTRSARRGPLTVSRSAC